MAKKRAAIVYHDWVHLGLKNRAIGHHNMNEHSSRSHTILTVHIHSEEKATNEDNKGVYITRWSLFLL